MSRKRKRPQEDREYILVMAAQALHDPDTTVEEGKMLDRLLRDRTLTDIHWFWVQWGYWAEKRGWLTNKEMVRKKGRRFYPDYPSGVEIEHYDKVRKLRFLHSHGDRPSQGPERPYPSSGPLPDRISHAGHTVG